MGVSLAQTTLARREQFHQSRLVERIGTWNPSYAQTMQQVQNYFATKPPTGAAEGAQRDTLGYIGQLVQVQASLWAYIDVFFSLMLIGFVITTLALTLRAAKGGTKPAAV